MAHVGAYDYMVASPAAPEFGSVNFMFKHISALVQLKLTVHQPSTITTVKLTTDSKAFSVEGKVDIMAASPCITALTPAKEIKLDLKNVKTTEEDQVVTLYMMLPPADLSAKTLKAVISTEKGSEEVPLQNLNFQAGKVYVLNGILQTGNDTGYRDGVVRLDKAGTMQHFR